jgi:CheY-like chemotaxis protein
MGLLSGLQILVVEDEILVLTVAESILTDLGCESIFSAVTVAQALEYIHDYSFDIVMLDMSLNGESSSPVADILSLRKIPFTFTTGYGHSDVRPCDVDRPLLVKPYSDEDLIDVLSTLLRQSPKAA